MSLSGWDSASWERRGSAGLSEGCSCGSSGLVRVVEGGWVWGGSGAASEAEGVGTAGWDCWGVEAWSSSSEGEESESSSQPMFSSVDSVAPVV